MSKTRIISIIILVICTVVFLGWLYQKSNNSTLQDTEPAAEIPAEKEQSQISEPSFDKQKYSLQEPSSLWVLVNKRNALPIDYSPQLIVPDVRLRLSPTEQQMQISPVVEDDLIRMFNASKTDGVDLVFGSGYRSAELQSQFYNSYVASDGQELADTYSARPGHSEHQTGLTVDITSPNGVCHLEICWENTPEGQWVKKNAHLYGFIIRYEKGKESITGYQYEPWHLRYVGGELAKEIYNKGVTLEEFFELPAAPDYL